MPQVIKKNGSRVNFDAEKLAARLTELSGMSNVFFCCTRLEANEAALKLARKYGHDKGI